MNFLHSYLAGVSIIGVCDTGGYGCRIFPGKKGHETESAGGNPE